jgi:hypothetical protein
LAIAIALAGCSGGGGEEPATTPQAPGSRPVADEPPSEPSSNNAPALFPDDTRSLVLTRTVGVHLEPGTDAKRIGNVAVDTRVAWKRTTPGKDCKRPWIEIEPRGWICGDYVEPSKKSPYGQEVPHLDRGEIVPGTYGKVTMPGAVTYTLEKPKKEKKKRGRRRGRDDEEDDAPKEPRMVEDKPLVGSVNVREYEELAMAGKTYWRIVAKGNQYVLRQAVSLHHPSAFAGARLADDTGWGVPIVFVWSRYGGNGQPYTTNKANGGGINRQLASRTPLPLLETVSDKAGKPVAYRVGEAEWINAADARVFEPAAPPQLLEPNERWIDVDVEHQILVAYEGELPVYATMVSTGGKDTPTEPGVYRMWLKESEADMKGLNGEDPYSVATVPWTQFFSPEKELALHTAYWHDQFGTRRSHGCVNLAPRDARWLYFWSDPQVPPGWTMAAGVVEAPGSIVRIRTKDDPDPETRGYAKKVLELRRQNRPAK